MNIALTGPGIDGMGIKSCLVDSAAWTSGGTVNLYMDKGTQGGTVLGWRLRLTALVTATPATVVFTDQQMRTAKNSIFALVRASSKLGPMVTSQSTGIVGGDIDLMNRAILRQKAGGTLDRANGNIAIGASEVVEHELPLYHFNPVTGLNHCPDLKYFRNLQLQVTAGGTYAVGSTTCTISYGTWALWCDYIPNQPGADSHLRWDQLSQSSETDTLPAQQRMGHLVTGANALTYAQSLAQLDTTTAINLNASTFLYKVGGKDPFDTDGYLNSALVWSEALRRLNRGATNLPGQDRYGVAGGFSSYTCTPLYLPNGEARNDYMDGEVVIQNATNLAPTSRVHSTIIVQRAGA